MNNSTKEKKKTVTKKKRKKEKPHAKFTEGLLNKICSLIAKGNYIGVAFRASGVSSKTLYYWLDKCNEGHPLYKNVVTKIEKAVAESETVDLGRIDEVAKTNWSAAAWKLARRHPERWAKKEFVEANVTDERVEKISESEKRNLVEKESQKLIVDTIADDVDDFE